VNEEALTKVRPQPHRKKGGMLSCNLSSVMFVKTKAKFAIPVFGFVVLTK